jgi:UDP-3-O-[3-hydroxymyristoyl] glucosamine N-acyltransferase
MADARFFRNAGPITLDDVIKASGAQLADGVKVQDGMLFKDVAPLDRAESGHLSFFDNKKYLESFGKTKASACFTRPEFSASAPAGTVVLLHRNPYKAYALAAALFYPAEPALSYRAATAAVDPSAKIGDNVFIGHYAVIGKNVDIGTGSRIGDHTVIGDGVVIGQSCDIAPHVTISHAIIGDRVRIHPGARLGSPGFGFAMDAAGFVSVPQLGRVIVEDDADIGANTAIDRGAGPDTVIGRGTRIDNLVQIAHNVKIGRQSIIVAQSGIAGSSELGDFVITGGQSGIAGHLKIGKGAKIAAQAGILQDLPAGAEVMGTPAVPLRQFFRQSFFVQKMAAAATFKKEEKNEGAE